VIEGACRHLVRRVSTSTDDVDNQPPTRSSPEYAALYTALYYCSGERTEEDAMESG